MSKPFIAVCAGHNIGDGPVDCQESITDGYSSKDEASCWEFLGEADLTDGLCSKCYEVTIESVTRNAVRDQLSRVGVEMQEDVGIDLYTSALYHQMLSEKARELRGEEGDYELIKEVREKILSIINFK